MSSNICGNCFNFKPKQGEKFFDCTSAVHAGLKYGMQVRPDTRSCDAFAPLKAATPPKPTPIPAPTAKRARPRPVGLCPWGRVILLSAIILIILLLSWGIYTCAKDIGGGPAPTPTPTPTPTSTEPTPTPIPQYIYQDLEMNQWAKSSTMGAYVHSPLLSYDFGGVAAPVGIYFISFSVTMTNIGLNPVSVSPYSFWLTDSFGTIFNAADNPVYYTWRYNPPTIYAGGTADGNIPYMVPTYASGLTVNYIIDRATVPPTVGRWKLPW